MENRLPVASVSVSQLRAAIDSEKAALQELVQVVEEQQGALDLNSAKSARQNKRQKLVTALTHVGGEDLQKARMEASQAAEALYLIAADIDKHNKEMQGLSLLQGLLKRRKMMRRANSLEQRRQEVMSAYEAARERSDMLLRSLATPDNISEVIRVSRVLRSRFRDAANKKKQLTIKRRLLLDNLNLCCEIDDLLAMLDTEEMIRVHESDLQTLLHDQSFQSSLRDRVKE